MKLLDSNKFILPGTKNRFLHIATLQEKFKEYICFIDLRTNQCYIEEISMCGGLSTINDDNLINEIKLLLDSKKLLDMKEIMEYTFKYVRI